MHTQRENPLRLAPRTVQPEDTGLDRVLALLERRQLSPSELRLLVALIERDQPVSALASRFQRRPSELRRVGERLYAQGLLRWRQEAPTEEPILGITRAGLALARPLLSAAELPRAA